MLAIQEAVACVPSNVRLRTIASTASSLCNCLACESKVGISGALFTNEKGGVDIPGHVWNLLLFHMRGSGVWHQHLTLHQRP